MGNRIVKAMGASQGGYSRLGTEDGARAMNGENLYTIQHVLNHSSLQHTAVYAKLDLSTVQAATERNVLRMLGVSEPTPVSAPAHSPAQERDLEEWPG